MGYEIFYSLKEEAAGHVMTCEHLMVLHSGNKLLRHVPPSPSSIKWYRPNVSDDIGCTSSVHHRLKWFICVKDLWSCDRDRQLS